MKTLTRRWLWIIVSLFALGGLGTCIGIKSERISTCRAFCLSKGYSKARWAGVTQYNRCICFNETELDLK